MNNSTPSVSVVMSCYNGERYIKEAIDSILAQTFTDFEFIIWDDGSTDSSRDIIESYQDDRIRYFYHENTGLGMALRLACEHAKGKYIARMDADDISLPERLYKEVEFLEMNLDYVLVSSAVRYIDENGIDHGRTFPCTKDTVLKNALLKTSMIVHPMVMMRRESYQEAGGYIPVVVFEDRIFWSRLAKYGKFANLSCILGKYRLLGSSISHISNPYSSVLYAYRNKMIEDEMISEKDIQLFNEIFIYSKRYQRSITKIKKLNRVHLEEILFVLFGGGKYAESLVCTLKDFYHIRRFSRVDK